MDNMNLKKVMTEEFIGKNAEIVSGSHCGHKGTIMDETMHTFMFFNGEKFLRIPKEMNTFNINGNIVDGNRIDFRPEDRIKKVR